MNRLALWSLLALALTGCGARVNYVLMRSSLFESGREDRPEITSTAEALSTLPRVRKVAVRAPDSCASQSAAETTGAANNRGSIVQTDCGVEMAELERALSRAGYSVYSWKQIQSMSRTMSAEAAARQLGAEVLFQVNSLERVTYVPSRDAQWTRQFFISDAQGTQGEPFALKQADVARLQPSFLAAEQLAMQRLGAMLDVNAVSTETGQSLWFYRRVRFEQPGAPHTGMLLRRTKQGWDPVAANAAAQPRPRPTDPVAVQSRTLQPPTRTDAAYFELMRAVVAEFTQQFAQGGQAAPPLQPSSPPPPPPMPPPAP